MEIRVTSLPALGQALKEAFTGTRLMEALDPEHCRFSLQQSSEVVGFSPFEKRCNWGITESKYLPKVTKVGS